MSYASNSEARKRLAEKNGQRLQEATGLDREQAVNAARADEREHLARLLDHEVEQLRTESRGHGWSPNSTQWQALADGYAAMAASLRCRPNPSADR